MSKSIIRDKSFAFAIKIISLSKKLKDRNVKVSTIARGVSFGGALEYTDELTLGRSIVARIPYRIKGE